MADMIHALRCSVAARWRADGEKRKRHWDTTQHYYRAFLTLADETGERPHWADLVTAARGTRSTFYTVTGRRALHPLLPRYAEAAPGLAARYPAPDAVSWLGHEAAVWAYWPHRTGWLRELAGGDRARAARALLFVLADFAAGRQGLMRALDGRPPLCAVEDFALVLGPAARAETLYDPLARLMTAVAAAPGLPPEVVADGTARELERLVRRRDGEEAQARLAEALETVLSDPDLSGRRQEEIGKLLRSAGEILLTGPGVVHRSSAA